MRRYPLALILSALVWPLVSNAEPAPATPGVWTHEIAPTVSVNDHQFTRVVVNAEQCKTTFQLYFSAPDAQYADPKNLVRNFHRFKARVRLGDHSVDSPSFINRQPGKRWFTWSHDSTAQGCWSRELTKMWKLDVNGCRGKPCAVEPF